LSITLKINNLRDVDVYLYNLSHTCSHFSHIFLFVTFPFISNQVNPFALTKYFISVLILIYFTTILILFFCLYILLIHVLSKLTKTCYEKRDPKNETIIRSGY